MDIERYRTVGALSILVLAAAASDRHPSVQADQPVPGTKAAVYLPIAMDRAALSDLSAPLIVTPRPTLSPTGVPTPTPDATELPPEPSATPPPTDEPLPACRPLAERVTTTTTDVGSTMRANDEYFPIVVAPKADGGSMVAWRDQRGLAVRVASFDRAGKMIGSPLSFPAEEVHALVAHENGGAMAVVENDPDIYSPKYCRGPSTQDKSYCAKMDLWRFDAKGNTIWRTTLTKKTNVDKDGAAFIWWYQHTARLAWSGSEYGLYYRSASSSPRPGVAGEIDIHAGDSFAFVDNEGAVLPSKWDWGCSHSWAIRLAFNGHFGSACHGDAYPNAFHQVVQDRQKRLGDSKLRENLDPTKRALGGMVPTRDGFWMSYMAEVSGVMALHLAFIDNAGKATKDIVIPAAKGLETQYPFRAYLAAYGTDRMLAGWIGGGKLQLAALALADGKLLDGPVATDAKIDKWVEFVTMANGDVGWGWNPANTAKLDLVRVGACR